MKKKQCILSFSLQIFQAHTQKNIKILFNELKITLEQCLNKASDEHFIGMLLCILVRKQETQKKLAKGKTKVANINLRHIQKFQAGLGCKKGIDKFHIWF